MYLEFGFDWGNVIGFECFKVNYCFFLRDY